MFKIGLLDEFVSDVWSCFLEVAQAQEAAIAWAAEKANWQILRFSLGILAAFATLVYSNPI